MDKLIKGLTISAYATTLIAIYQCFAQIMKG